MIQASRFTGSHTVDCFDAGLLDVPPWGWLLRRKNHTQRTSLDLVYNRIKHIAANAFGEVPWVETIRMEYNEVAALRHGMLAGLPSLRLLTLHHNAITLVESSSFMGMRNVEEIDLEGNLIRDVVPGTFKGLVKLQRLVLSHNDISRLRKGVFRGIVELKALMLDSNHIGLNDPVHSGFEPGCFFNSEIREMIVVERLSLASNQIKNLSKATFDKLPLKNQFDLSFNQISHIDDGIGDAFFDLDGLELSNNALTLLRSGMFSEVSYFKALRVASNYLMSLENLPFNYNSADYLELLDLTANQITHIGQ